jgi:hypothetical protein
VIRSIAIGGRIWTAIMLSVGLGACAPLVEMEKPSPEGPRISHLRFAPPETVAGCPVNAKFRLETTTEEIVSAKEAWVRRHGRSSEYRSAMLPVDFDALRDKHAGEIEARFIPRESGTFYYYVQVGDRSGRMSNVLRATLAVDPSWAEPASPCPEGARND